MNGQNCLLGIFGIAVLVATGCGPNTETAPDAADEPTVAEPGASAPLDETRPNEVSKHTPQRVPDDAAAETPTGTDTGEAVKTPDGTGQAVDTPDKPDVVPTPKTTEVTIQRADVVAYEELRKTRSYGDVSRVMEVMKKGGHVFLVVRADIAIQWGDSSDPVSVPGNQLLVIDDQGQTHAAVGTEEHGLYSMMSYFRRSWPADPGRRAGPNVATHNAVFLVPRDTRPVKFKLGEIASLEINGPDKTESPPPPTFPDRNIPGTSARFEILDAKLIDEFHGQVKLGKEEHQTSISSLRGKLLRVDFRITPIRHTSERSGTYHFSWSTPDIGLLNANGQYIPTIGEDFTGGLGDRVGHGQDLWQGKWRSQQYSFLFAVPTDTQSFTLTFHMTPVAEGKVGGPFRTLESK
jgi:hypothetical protein